MNFFFPVFSFFFIAFKVGSEGKRIISLLRARKSDNFNYRDSCIDSNQEKLAKNDTKNKAKED